MARRADFRGILRPLLKPVGLALVLALGLSVVAEAQLRPGSFSILRVVTRIVLGSGTQLSDTASGKLLITGTTPMIQLGGTTSSFSALMASPTRVQAKLADGSAFTAFDAGTLTSNAGGVAMVGANDALFIGGGGTTKLLMATAPSSPTACGTSPTVTASNGSAVFVITGGTGGVATGCQVTMPTATTGWACNINNITGSAAHRADKTTVQTASTTTSVTWEYQTVSTGAATAFTASDVFRGICFAY